MQISNSLIKIVVIQYHINLLLHFNLFTKRNEMRPQDLE